MKKRKLPIGLSDFRRMIEDRYYYVDKSLLIKELVDSGAIVTILPRPRRFGKTLNLNMIRCFFEKTDKEENLFAGLAIEKAGEEYTSRQGRYPVLYLTFKDVKFSSWDRCLGKIEREISALCRYYSVLTDHPALSNIEKQKIDDINNERDRPELYIDSLKLLSEYLFKVYGEKVLILIDEYDIPIQQGYAHGFYDEAVEFIKPFLSGGLKDNPYLEMAVLTGILRVSKESIFSDLNNPRVCTLLSRQYADKFGLTEEEVIHMLEYFGIYSEIDHVRDWYNGYICGDTQIYNPWSIINYAFDWKEGLKPYWVNTSSNLLIKKLLSRGDKEINKGLMLLMEDKTVTKPVNENIVFPDLENHPDNIYSFLLFSGYLKPVKSIEQGDEIVYELAIPNKEVHYLYKHIISSWFTETIRDNKMEIMLKSLLSGDIDTFHEIFASFVELTLSYFHTGEAEKVYQAFTLGLMLNLNRDYLITSEEPSGYGRADLMITPKDRTRPGVVMEFKVAGKVKIKTLEKALEAAKEQIITKNYKSKLEALGVKKVIQVAIGFKGKEVALEEV